MTIRPPLVVANWKMHGNRQTAAELVSGVAQGVAGFIKAEIVICPPAIFLGQVAELIKSSPLKLGAQNVNAYAEGAYTGEIAPGMLCDAGCQYVIVGHSERRALYKETDEDVAAKCAAVIKHNMTPIVCVGETLQERESGQTEKVVYRQLMAVLNVVSEHLEKLVIAYEPVWAIGTGKTATSEQAQAIHHLIRKWLCAVNKFGERTRILYGGSVKASNAADLFSMPDVDGGLVGGASLIVDEFVAICKAAELKERE